MRSFPFDLPDLSASVRRDPWPGSVPLALADVEAYLSRNEEAAVRLPLAQVRELEGLMEALRSLVNAAGALDPQFVPATWDVPLATRTLLAIERFLDKVERV